MPYGVAKGFFLIPYEYTGLCSVHILMVTFAAHTVPASLPVAANTCDSASKCFSGRRSKRSPGSQQSVNTWELMPRSAPQATVSGSCCINTPAPPATGMALGVCAASSWSFPAASSPTAHSPLATAPFFPSYSPVPSSLRPGIPPG